MVHLATLAHGNLWFTSDTSLNTDTFLVHQETVGTPGTLHCHMATSNICDNTGKLKPLATFVTLGNIRCTWKPILYLTASATPGNNGIY